MSDTPRTDALIADLSKDSGCKPEGNDLLVIELLRQFERELGQQANLSSALDRQQKTMSQFASKEDWARELERELDAARDVVEAARMLTDALKGGFVRCWSCGAQEDTTNLGSASTVREALAAYDSLDNSGLRLRNERHTEN